MKALYEFNGPHEDRSHIDLRFDGMLLRLVVEDMKINGAFVEITFEDVVHIEFEGWASMIAFPNDCAERIVESSAESYLEGREQKFSILFNEDTKMYRVFLNDYGLFNVVAQSCGVRAVSDAYVDPQSFLEHKSGASGLR